MDPRSLTRDFKEFLRSLNDHGVEYPVRAHFIGLGDLKINKRASGRNKDLADLDQLP
jgi:hypothetical protein